MANLAKTTLFTSAEAPKETALDKTTRIVRRMNDEDAEKRHLKAAQLRRDRFNKEASETVETSPASHSGTRKKG
jgi:hypothetical protein